MIGELLVGDHRFFLLIFYFFREDLALETDGFLKKHHFQTLKGLPGVFVARECEKGATVAVAPETIIYGYPAWRSEHGNG